MESESEADEEVNADSWFVGNIAVSSIGHLEKKEAEDYINALGLDEDFDGIAEIEVDDERGTVGVNIRGEGVTMERIFDKADSLVINNYFKIDNSSKYKGRGTEIFTRQVEELRSQGYKAMETNAAGSGKKNKQGAAGGYNGFYTWARLGYSPNAFSHNAYIKPILAQYNMEYITDYKTLNELVATKDGQRYWKHNGVSWSGEFDLTEGSENHKNLKAYNDAKAKN